MALYNLVQIVFRALAASVSGSVLQIERCYAALQLYSSARYNLHSLGISHFTALNKLWKSGAELVRIGATDNFSAAYLP